MPGFDRTGPNGMGPMTGGARGLCNPHGRRALRAGFTPWARGGRGRGRGYRNMYWASGPAGSMRSDPVYPGGAPFSAPYNREQEVDFLKEQGAYLKDELDAIGDRLRDLESNKKQPD